MQQPAVHCDGAPVEITAKARRVPQWTLVDDSPGPLPVSPVTTKPPGRDGDAGALRRGQLRITAFPYLIPGQEAPPRAQ